jgi:hypothetical protein
MKTIVSFLLLLSSSVSFAQNTILAGKITGSNGKPLVGATIRVMGENEQAVAKSNENGLYYSKLLPEGDYNVAAVVNRKVVKAGSPVHLENTGRTRMYYLLQVKQNNLVITTTDKDLFAEAHLAKVKEEQKHLDVPVGKVQFQPVNGTATSTGEKIPQKK